MTVRKLLKFVFALLSFFAVAIGLISIDHPIILKWLAGSASHHGKPMPATIYTNGQPNNDIKIYYTDEPTSYLLSLSENDSLGMLTCNYIDLNGKRVDRLVAISKNDLDIIAGHLFQSKKVVKLPFHADKKSINFDPQLTFKNRQIHFNMPTNELNIDSVRIILP